LAQIFSKQMNKLPGIVTMGAILIVVSSVLGIWYWWSPLFTDVGYMPLQPLPYSHALHVGKLGLDCRYCHTGVETSAVAMVPPTQTCMNCHTLIKADSPKLALLRASWNSKIPIHWLRIHKVPDYAYFDHSAHLRVGVGCESCHGNIAAMEVVELKEPLSMSWCLDCHRDPLLHLRPHDQITTMGWVPPANQREFAEQQIKALHINPPQKCSGCHR